MARDFETLVSHMGKPYIDRKARASEIAIRNLVSASGLDFPSAYLEFLRHSNGAEGDLPVEPYWFIIWRAERVIKQNEDLKIDDYAPGFFAFGSNGGNELLAFEIQESQPWQVYSLRLVPKTDTDASGERSERSVHFSEILHKWWRSFACMWVKRDEDQISQESIDARVVVPDFETFVDYMGKRYTEEE